MPVSPPKHCPRFGHPAYRGSRCPLCQKASQQAAEARRPNARQRGYTYEWQKAAKAFLSQPGNDRCVECNAPASVVDHRIAHKGDQRLFWDRSNWQPMCKRCNTRKANRTEGGYGNAVR